MQNNKIISNLLNERSNFIIIGLTGRTGSGCTTAANFLKDIDSHIPEVDEVTFKDSERGSSEAFFNGLNKNRYELVRDYAVKNNKTPFKVIKISNLISAILLNLSDDKLYDFVNNSFPDSKLENLEIKAIISKHNKILENLTQINNYVLKDENTTSETTSHTLNKWYSVIEMFTVEFKEMLNKLSPDGYIKIYQNAGDSIRRIGEISNDYNGQDFKPEGLYFLPRMINRIIKLYRKIDKNTNQKISNNEDRHKTYIVIDTIRNPYEAKYFKDRYAAFYLVSINAPEFARKKYLQDKYQFTPKQVNEIDIRESGKSPIKNKDKYQELVAPNVKRCIEISDIHIYNPRNEPQNHNVLKAQLIWYLSLMKHPGLITPTPLERVMQLAYTAKMNSGCISRQVGAVVTDSDYSIKSVGWNDVAKGQVPCNLRSLKNLLNFSNNTTYSEYERNNEDFRKQAQQQLEKINKPDNKLENSGRSLAYCFKSIQNKVDGEKNQVHTRSLHAEENAFLQLAKYGGVGIEGCKLFTTASPCELCAKKAYQLGIKEIVYIDPYPGIAIQHILQIGINPPKLTQFRGAVGKGYHQLYEPLMPYKDELDYLTE